MALSEAHRRQLHRLPVADGSFGKSDRFALHGIPEALSPNLTAAQRRQWHFIPIADASIDVGDRYTLHGITQTIAVGGPIIEQFNTSVFITPTWTVTELPQVVTGAIEAGIGPFIASFPGSFTAAVSTSVGAHSLSFSSAARNIELLGVARTIAISGSSGGVSAISALSRTIIFSSLGKNMSIIGTNKTIDIE